MKFIETIAKYVEDKVVDFGAQTIMGIVAASPVGAAFAAASRFSDFIETRGASEFEDFASSGVPKLNFKFQGEELLQKIQDAISNPTPSTQRRRGNAQWRRSRWASSRQEWLTQAWKHDWRSQPRDALGRWIPGRLDHPVQAAPSIGKGTQRTSRRKRRLNRYKRFGRIAARSFKFNGD